MRVCAKVQRTWADEGEEVGTKEVVELLRDGVVVFEDGLVEEEVEAFASSTLLLK